MVFKSWFLPATDSESEPRSQGLSSKGGLDERPWERGCRSRSPKSSYDLVYDLHGIEIVGVGGRRGRRKPSSKALTLVYSSDSASDSKNLVFTKGMAASADSTVNVH